MVYEFTVKEDYSGKKLNLFLRNSCQLSSSLVRSIKYEEDGLLVNGIRAKTDQILHAGQTVTINVPAKINLLSSSDIKVPIVFENESVLVFDKPAGIATHPTLNYANDTLANVYATLVRSRNAEDVFRPINRLDKNTSGLVIAAKDRYAAPMLARHSDKQYYAVVQGVLQQDADTIDAPIAREGISIIKRSVNRDGAPSVTNYEVVERYGDHTLVRVIPFTGRTHQIRVHMAYIGHPLAGDSLYGGSTDWIARQALHCAVLRFTDPQSGRQIELRSPMPRDMKTLVDCLKREMSTQK